MFLFSSHRSCYHRILEHPSTDCRSKFHHVLTSQGICTAYNAVPFNSFFTRTKFTRFFSQVYNVKRKSERRKACACVL